MSSTATSQDVAPKIATPKPALSGFDAVMIITGIVIGAGIYSVPPLVAKFTGSVEWMLAAWVLGGVLSLIGALNYAELATTFPNAGGDYHFLTRAYGKDVSFFFAWARVTVITTGSIALLGFVFGDYMSKLLSLGPYSSALYAALTVIVLTAINIAGLRESARTQNVLTLIEVGGLVLVIVAGLMIGGSAPIASSPPPASSGFPAMFGLAMVFILLTYGGWNEAAYISAEVKGGKRAILKALVLALLLITACYIVFVLALLYGLGFDGIQKSNAVAADVVGKAFGSFGITLVGLGVAVATLTSINATMLVGARTNYALGNDWPIVAFMSRWHGERDAPVRAFLVQGALALALIVLGAIETDGFKTMVEFTAPVFWFFFLLTGIAVFVLRFKYPHVARPFKVPLYPVLPLAFIATCAYLLYSSITYAQSQKAVHVAFYVMAAGVVAWIIARLKKGT
ncbi:MAG TPA: amino acid permease [Burkholderiaceae bacterium]|jgi:amino acid transporter|nr:amino acid permease [Burkholderiaceae bacterium]